MSKILVLIADWLLKNTVQKVLKGAGLGIVSYLAILTSVRVAFDSLINSAYSAPATLLNLMGLFGIDYVMSSLVSVAVFLLTLKSTNLSIKKM